MMMAMSVQACYPNSCKNQHSIKTMSKSPNFLRRGSSMRQNSGNRRSAVERLEESKANYVKSERVLDCKQEFKNSSHLRVSTGPQLDLLFKPPPKLNQDKSPTSVPNDFRCSGYKFCPHSPTAVPARSPPVVRARAKSHSEFRDTQINRRPSFTNRSGRLRIEASVDVESQLKRLISSNSKENVAAVSDNRRYSPAQVTEAQLYYKNSSEIPKVRRGYSDPIKKSTWFPPDSSPEKNYSIHKSMPDLSPLQQQIRSHEISSDESSDDCIFPSLAPTPAPPIRHFSPENKPLVAINPMLRNEACTEEVFTTYQEPRRFSNGTGTLHLTPYFSPNNQFERRPVSRSKSDVSHRYSKRNSEYFPRRNNYTSAEIERFFDTMGLDTVVWHHITSPSIVSSPPCFFESISSVDSNEARSSVCSEDSIPDIPREGLRNYDLRVHGPLETSIVEKNARVIKWLYNCRKAARES